MISIDKINSIADLPGVIGILQQGDRCRISGSTHDYAGERKAKPTLIAALDLYARDLLGSDVVVTVGPTPASLRFFVDGIDGSRSRSRVVVACAIAHPINKSIQRVILGAMSRGC